MAGGLLVILFFVLLIEVKLDVFFTFLLVIIYLNVDVFLVIYMHCGRLLLLPPDSCQTIFAVPFFYFIKFFLRFITKIRCALRVQPRTIGALLVTIAFYEEL